MTRAHVVAEQGAAGDMLLGALVDAGAPLPRVRDAVGALGLGLDVTTEQVTVRGVRATRARVLVPADAPRVPTLADAEALLDRAALRADVRADARRVFGALAEAEAAVHGVAVTDVVLHELGNPDTAADVVGVCAAVRALGLERLSCGPVALGAGEADTDHGRVAVPPPAVTELLRGFVVRPGGRAPARELTTPTGAALLATLAEPDGGGASLRLATTGRGAGDPDRPEPSVLTVLVGDDADAGAAVAGTGAQPAVVVEATVDDLAGEHVPVVLDRLRERGAHDAWAVPALMKKGRPGHTLTALGDEAAAGALADVLVREAGTLGVRVHRVDKHALPRRWVEVEVAGVPVRVKVGELDGQAVVVAGEHDDVARAAAALRRPAREVAADAVAAARGMLAADPAPGQR